MLPTSRFMLWLPFDTFLQDLPAALLDQDIAAASSAAADAAGGYGKDISVARSLASSPDAVAVTCHSPGILRLWISDQEFRRCSLSATPSAAGDSILASSGGQGFHQTKLCSEEHSILLLDAPCFSLPLPHGGLSFALSPL